MAMASEGNNFVIVFQELTKSLCTNLLKLLSQNSYEKVSMRLTAGS